MELRALLDWLTAFVFTQAVEVPLYLRVTTSWRVSFLASTFTHPVVWFIFPAVWPAWAGGYVGMVVAAETFAVLVEAWWLKRNGVHGALLQSFIANSASAGLGMLLRDAFGVP